MAGLPIAFAAPAVLFGLIALPVIWWLLRLTPPRPKTEVFPPLRILARVLKREETPARSPWWLTLLRLAIAALVIFALADPVLNPRDNDVSTAGPLALVVDNGWASAPDWPERVRAAEALIADAEARNVPVSLTLTAERNADATPTTAAAARERLRAAAPRPNFPARDRAADALAAGLAGTRPGTLAYLTDGIATPEGAAALQRMVDAAPERISLLAGDPAATVAITTAENAADGFAVEGVRLATEGARSLPISAYDVRGRPIATGTLAFADGEATGKALIAAPFELRNEFARIGIDSLASAGATYLLDDSFRRRRVALLSGEPLDLAQPLLSPLYYIRRALQPYADLVEPRETDLAQAIPQLLAERPSVLVMADIGTLPRESYAPIQRWIENGGTLLRFAGPRLAGAAADDPLVPVTLRQGERALGGSLSWTEPQPLADFPVDSPFAGIAKPADVTVTRQVLAEPSPDLAARTWASLADGTPLVTTRNIGTGRIVLFHVTAEATWSNLPISGAFVEMLRRTILLSRAGGAGAEAAGGEARALPPYRLLDARGTLAEPSGDARPLELAGGTIPRPTFDNPPGLYGTEDGFRALNLLRAGDRLEPLAFPQTAIPVARERIGTDPSRSLKPWLFGAALALLLLDSLVMLFLSGAFSPASFGSGGKWRPGRRAAANLIVAGALGVALALSAAVMFTGPAQAADEKPGDDAALAELDQTHIAYVLTGDDAVDRVSARGLEGLTEFLAYRTALEPGKPTGLNIETDTLDFYPLIYWPISAAAPMPSAAAISRIDTYMKNGGTVLFDTRDQLTSLDQGSATSPETERLRAILADLDIPPLEPVPANHVLTKAFYLMTDFPGRYRGSPLWVEAQPEDQTAGTSTGTAAGGEARPARAGDGVSSIIITGNDLAGAWAVDDNGVPLFPTVPPDPEQREYAFRTGVNIMMYMLTGNYKADQVHVPALLERLGQ